ncbi:MAG: glycosyltransferase family 39 protein [Candidatus Sulfotelmatobacter sp.]
MPHSPMAPPTESCPNKHSPVHYILLTAALLACLLPFSGKAFNVDDTLFVYVARQIAKHWLDPYGFKVNWYRDAVPMAVETKNPPLASYYLAAAASIVGWSERALHVAFFLPALAVVLGTYRLALRFTDSPLLAAVATLLAPGFLVSANSVMCDVMMLALWLWAVIFWIEGFAPQKPLYLLGSALLITACALTKFFGIALIPLIAVYSLARQHRLGNWAWYLLLPILALTGFQHWTKAVYGLRMITSAAHVSTGIREGRQVSALAKLLVDLSFVGGCVLPGLTLAPLLWPRRKILAVCGASGVAAFFLATGRIDLGGMLGPPRFYPHWLAVGVQLTFFMAAGFSVMALATGDGWKRKDADSVLLLLWVFGTFIFTGFLNWTINARSVLPLIPAAGILLARRSDALLAASTRFRRPALLAIPLAVSGLVSIWLTWADTEMANSARTAATLIEQRTRNQPGTVWFTGHWGFQYYMESFGARPVVLDDPPRRRGDFLALGGSMPLYEIRPNWVASRDVIRIPMRLGITTIQSDLGAGFYSFDSGPLPFALGPLPPERYELIRLGSSLDSSDAAGKNSLPASAP